MLGIVRVWGVCTMSFDLVEDIDRKVYMDLVGMVFFGFRISWLGGYIGFLSRLGV